MKRKTSLGSFNAMQPGNGSYLSILQVIHKRKKFI